jgi:chemotaxis-related protein WspD
MTEPSKQAERPLSSSSGRSDANPGASFPGQNAAPMTTNFALDARTFFDRQPPPQYLEEWVQRLAQPEECVEQDLQSLVIFRLHDEYLAVQTRSLVEVTLPQSIHTIPHRTNEVVLGLVNVRGQLRICVSAHGLLGVASPATNEPTHRSEVPRTAQTETSEQRMLIIHERSEQWVFPVEAVLGVHRLPVSCFRPVPATFGKAGAFSQAVFTWESHTVGYLDEARFISALRSASK